MANKFNVEIKNFIKRLLGLEYRVVCYSQEGEDIILDRLLADQQHGFYVDIGAHHPKRFSNTYLFYRRGWRGMNIDAMPGSMEAFRRIRPRDINLEIGISAEKGVKEFHVFHEEALNTFNGVLAEEHVRQGWKRKNIVQVHVETVNTLLAEHVPVNTHIDFLTIDIEGLDDAVLTTLDFTRYHPRVIVCEALNKNVQDVLSSKLASLLTKEGYYLHSKLCNSCIWKSTKEKY
jgi:FkbM family methyltransferase